MIPSPYLLYIGNETDELSIKTSRGLAHWRPNLCVGQYRSESCTLSLGLPDLTFEEAVKRGASTLVLGIANAGGIMRAELINDAVVALEAGLNVASGLHSRLAAQPAIVTAAKRCKKRLYDVRDSPSGLRIGNGYRRTGHRLLTVGTDCSVGKMYTTLALERELRSRGVPVNFRATGQTGILIAGSGVAIDAIVADFISGAVECLSSARDDLGWDLIEGQGSLFHPSFAGVTLGLLHGAQPDAIVLCHDPGRAHMRGLPGRPLPTLSVCLDANLRAARLTNPEVRAVGVALNTEKLDSREATHVCALVSDQLGLPCEDPIRNGVTAIVERMMQEFSITP